MFDSTVPLVKNLLLMDSEGKRIAVKYYDEDYLQVSKQANFEKSVFAKTSKTPSRSEGKAGGCKRPVGVLMIGNG